MDAAINIIKSQYEAKVRENSDINQHLPTFRHFASLGNIITELGTRGFVSGWGWLVGMLDNPGKELICVDLNSHPNIEYGVNIANKAGINLRFVQGDDVKITPWTTDILFIDTFHVYPHLREELRVWAQQTKKYILLHDTEIDAIHGEAIRSHWNIANLSQKTGYSEDDLRCGLKRAIDEFLANTQEWRLHTHYINNNGLTILERIN